MAKYDTHVYTVFVDRCFNGCWGSGSSVPTFAFTSFEAAKAWTIEHSNFSRFEWHELVYEEKWETTALVSRFGDDIRYRIERCPMGA